jgi:endonuclease/exonuclease/phosphatase family metal-dependent hydrolase
VLRSPVWQISYVRLATFNLMHGLSITDGTVALDRLHASAAVVDADVVGLQEVDRGQPRTGGEDLAAIVADALNAPHFCFVPAVVGTPGETFRPATEADRDSAEPLYGTALVSRYPVVEWKVTRLPGAPVSSPIVVPNAAGRGRLMFFPDEPRVVVAGIIETPFGKMTIASTHLSFVPGWNIRQLRRVVGALRRLPGPRVLLADLNLPGPLAGWASGWRRLAQVPSYPSPRPKVQFDHVLLDARDAAGMPPVVRVSTPDVSVSDHRPVIVEC